jgi:hypothetical protein
LGVFRGVIWQEAERPPVCASEIQQCGNKFRELASVRRRFDYPRVHVLLTCHVVRKPFVDDELATKLRTLLASGTRGNVVPLRR